MSTEVTSYTDPLKMLAFADSYDSLIEALRTRKAQLELSDSMVDVIGGLTRGHTEKILGPSRTKKLSPMTMDVLLATLAVKICIVEDVDAAKIMEGRWEQRVANHVRTVAGRVSKRIVEQAKPHLYRQLQLKSSAAKMKCFTAEHRSRIARKAAKSRWKKRKSASALPIAPDASPSPDAPNPTPARKRRRRPQMGNQTAL
jgi:hypothetical protein